MFADPFSNLMLLILLFFAGLLIMFIFMMRSIEGNWRNQEETRRQMALSLNDLERKVGELSFLLKSAYGTGEELPEEMPVQDTERRLPLLSFSEQDDGQVAERRQEEGRAAIDDMLRFDESYYQAHPAPSRQEGQDLPGLLGEDSGANGSGENRQ